MAVPGTVPLVAPPDSAVDQPSTVPFEWERVPDATTYHLQVATDPEFNNLVFEDSTLTEPNAEVGPLAYSVTHYWRIRAKNAGGIGPWSNRRSFVVAVGTSVVEREEGIPHVYALYQNYPNPFNPTSTIRFDLPEPVYITLTVFDVQGKAVATLVDGSMAAGSYTITFDAGKLPSGLYLYQLRSSRWTQTKKMLLVR